MMRQLTKREELWVELSKWYLDSPVEESDYERLVAICQDQSIDYQQLELINRTEVYPVLCFNLLSVAGEWGCFDQNWLLQALHEYQRRPRWRKWLGSWHQSLWYRVLIGDCLTEMAKRLSTPL